MMTALAAASRKSTCRAPPTLLHCSSSCQQSVLSKSKAYLEGTASKLQWQSLSSSCIASVPVNTVDVQNGLLKQWQSWGSEVWAGLADRSSAPALTEAQHIAVTPTVHSRWRSVTKTERASKRLPAPHRPLAVQAGVLTPSDDRPRITARNTAPLPSTAWLLQQQASAKIHCLASSEEHLGVPCAATRQRTSSMQGSTQVPFQELPCLDE